MTIKSAIRWGVPELSSDRIFCAAQDRRSGWRARRKPAGSSDAAQRAPELATQLQIHSSNDQAGDAVVDLIHRLPEWPRHHFVNASYSSDSIETKPATCGSGLSGRRGARIPIPPFRTGSVPVAFCELRHGHLHGPIRPASYHTSSVLSSGRVFVTRPIHRCPGRHGHYLGLICKRSRSPMGPTSGLFPLGRRAGGLSVVVRVGVHVNGTILNETSAAQP